MPEDLSEEAQQKLYWVNKSRNARAFHNDALEKQLIQKAADALGYHTGSIPRIVTGVEKRGLCALERSPRSDKGKSRYVSDAWRRLVIELYK
ncbi:hypothetical protein H6F86_24970 [Phormidium sp. FACHB-592]|uniref:Uncharacterized protein n=1 Tax=Stenomitos frigidus AS-A4 TaxID=2933935 RepID=A0ABV0KMQ0_9CYAN|nr:hypothetical protein [Phormidium sp. FACHB-592]